MLTNDEINLLLEAVEIWKDMMPVEGHQMGEMVSGMMSGDPEQLKATLSNIQQEAQRKRRSRKEQAILLQAKLIQMRDAADVTEAAEFMKKVE